LALIGRWDDKDSGLGLGGVRGPIKKFRISLERYGGAVFERADRCSLLRVGEFPVKTSGQQNLGNGQVVFSLGWTGQRKTQKADLGNGPGDSSSE